MNLISGVSFSQVVGLTLGQRHLSASTTVVEHPQFLQSHLVEFVEVPDDAEPKRKDE